MIEKEMQSILSPAVCVIEAVVIQGRLICKNLWKISTCQS